MSRIAILYPGALGAALGKAIGAAGDRAITCLSGRSAMTRQRALAARFTLFPSVADVARCSEIIVSLVSPNSALMVANQFATLAANQLGENTRPIFIEANSVTPGTKKQIAEMLSSEGIACLDGAFLGPANRVGKENVLLLSGAGADSVAPIFRRVVETRVVGDEIGQAASLKMTMAILTKALPALFVEMVCV